MCHHEELALEYFRKGFSCAQSVLAAFTKEIGMDEEVALKLASGFGAGFGRMREVCGAFSALTMIVGLKNGNIEGTPEAKQKIYELIQNAAEQFKGEFSSLLCRDILGPEINSNLEGTLPETRTTLYYSGRPCEKCITYSVSLIKKITTINE